MSENNQTSDRAPSENYEAEWDGLWNDAITFGPMHRQSRRIMLRMISDLPFTSVMDVGCGDGAMLEAIGQAHPDAALMGSDISPTGVAATQKRLPGSNTQVADLSQVPADMRADLVVCADVVEHIEDDQTAINNIATMTNDAAVIATLQGRMRSFEDRVGHVRNYAHGELQSKMEAAGFEIDRVIEWGWPFYSPLYRDAMNMFDGKGTTGQFGTVRKLISHGLFGLFCLNRWTRGDYIFVRGRKR